MKKTAALLIALLLTICLVSCVSSRDDSSSMPIMAESEVSEATSSDEVSSEESSNPTASTPQSSSAESSSSDESSSVPSSSETTSSTPQEEPLPDPKPPVTPVESTNYFGYRNLKEHQKSAYDKMLAAVTSMPMPNHYIPLGSADTVSVRDVYLVALTLKNDRPDIFWLPYAWYIGETHDGQQAILFVNNSSDKVDDIEKPNAAYIVDNSQRLAMEKELSAAVKEIKSKVTATNPYGIQLQLHELLCQKVTYSKKVEPLSYTAYGALVTGEAVCEGYTRAMQLLLYEFGINSTPVVGNADGPHMWNLVELGKDKWYHLDITWNDQSGEIRHTYFNLTDSAIKKDHSISPDFDTLTDAEVLEGKSFNHNLPICNSTEEYYFSKTGYTYNKNPDALADYIINSGVESLEIIGWDDNATEALYSALAKKSFSKKFNIYYDPFEPEWAKFKVINTANNSEV